MDTIRIGRISAINYTDGTARIVYTDRDNAVTPELPLLSAEYCMPKVDDLVLVLHLPTGASAGSGATATVPANRVPVCTART